MKGIAVFILLHFCFVVTAQQEITPATSSIASTVITAAGNTPLPPCSPAAANNNYANAIILTVGAAAINGSTCMSTLEAGEALGCNTTATQSVWYRFTSTAGTSYVIIDATGSNCYVGSAVWPGAVLPTNRCTMLDCQCADYGPLVTVFKITGTAGTAYSIQVVYTSGGLCGNQGLFTIRAANSYAGTISNPGSTNTCATANPGCYFVAPPTVAAVTGTCTGYPLTTQTNLVNNYFVRFTTASVNSIQLSFQDIIQSTCGAGNVDWFFYRLFDASCNLLTCGDLGNLQNNVGRTALLIHYTMALSIYSYRYRWLRNTAC
jgi:hypothetical protein